MYIPFIESDHPLYETHLKIMAYLFQEFPFASSFTAISEALFLGKTSFDRNQIQILYPHKQKDLKDAITDHIIYRTNQYAQDNHAELIGIKKTLHQLIMAQLQFYPMMPITLKKILPSIMLSAKPLTVLWTICDHLWILAGDTSTDYNYYTKRLLLSKIYSDALLFALSDSSPLYKDTSLFLERAFDKIGLFEKAKKKMPNLNHFGEKCFSFLGKIRYKI